MHIRTRIKIEKAKNRILTIWCNGTKFYDQHNKYRLQMNVHIYTYMKDDEIPILFLVESIESNEDGNSMRSEEKRRQYEKTKEK